jgi:hypothetical protein
MGVMYGLIMVGMGILVEMRGPVGMIVDVGVGLALSPISPQQQATPQASDEHARDTPQPGVQTLRDDVV